MKLNIHTVDAFTETQFGGNSAAVIITDQWLSEELMQSIAMENNLSETAYLKKQSDDHYQIRWFSPLTEIPFCGHATLAAAHVVFSEQPQLSRLQFFAEAVGTLSIQQAGDGAIVMDFPNRKPQPVEQPPQALLQGLSLKPIAVLRNTQAYFAVYAQQQDVLQVTQQTQLIKQLAPLDVVVTAPGTDCDFVSRYFWPASGGDEDPVTGSIHTGLAPYWAEQLGKNELRAYQASARGGTLNCRVDSDRVFISGHAVPYLQGQITV